MGFIYSEGKPYEGPNINVWGFKPETVLARFVEHYSNFLILNVMSKESRSFAERGQVERELEICKRKIAFWKRHPNFDADTARREQEKLIKAWKGRV